LLYLKQNAVTLNTNGLSRWLLKLWICGPISDVQPYHLWNSTE